MQLTHSQVLACFLGTQAIFVMARSSVYVGPGIVPPTLGISGFWILSFRKMQNLDLLPVGFGVWEGLESIGNGCGASDRPILSPNQSMCVCVCIFNDFV